MAHILISLSLFVITSFLGYKLFALLGFPASRIIGPIVAVATLQYIGFQVTAPQFFQSIFSVVFGVYLGLRFDRQATMRLTRLKTPVVALALAYVLITMLYGSLLMKVSTLDQSTSFLAVIPGGVAEAGALALSFGADLAQVSAFQLLRYFSIVMIIPLLAKHVIARLVEIPEEPPERSNLKGKDYSDLNASYYSATWIFAVGSVGALIFQLIGFPAALLLGATFGVALLQRFSKKEFKTPHIKIYEYAQIGMGAMIGVSFTPESIKTILADWRPMLMMTVLIITTSVLLAYVFSRVFKISYMTGFMSVLPGGLSTMIVLAEDFNTDIVVIGTLQLARLVTAVAVIPLIYQWVL